MVIHNEAKKILQYMLDKVIACGNLDARFSIDYETLAKVLGFENKGHCRICFQYLCEKGYIKHLGNDKDEKIIQLTAQGIDFLEFTEESNMN